MTSALATKTAQRQVEKAKEPTIRDWIEANRQQFEEQLSGAMNSGAFVRAAISEISNSEKLQQATPSSILGSIMLAAQLKLEIGRALGHFWLTPRQDHGKWTCLPIVGYQGFIELAYRSGRVGKVETFLVREGDTFEYGANSERGRFFDWKPLDRDENRPWTDAVVTAQILGGGLVWESLPREKVLARRPNGWNKGSTSPWQTHEEEMARKTLVREVAPYLPKSTEFGLAVQVTRQVEEEGKVAQLYSGSKELVVTEDEATQPDAPDSTDTQGEMTPEQYEAWSAAAFAREQEERDGK